MKRKLLFCYIEWTKIVLDIIVLLFDIYLHC